MALLSGDALGGNPDFPGNGDRPPRRGDRDSQLSAWGRFTRGGQNCGKKAVLKYDASITSGQSQSVPLLSVTGDDADACQIILTIAPPLVVPLAFADIPDLNLQNLTGEQDNFQVISGNFPGTAEPIEWPQLECVIEWGVGGTSCRAIVDIVNGATVNLVASFVRVHAVVAPSQRSGFVGTSAAYVLSAFIGPGMTIAKVAQKTVYVGTVRASPGSPATLALGADIGIGDMVLTWNVDGPAVGTVTIIKDEGIGSLLLSQSGNDTTITLPEASEFSSDIETLIGADSTLFHVSTPDSNPANGPWVVGGPFAFVDGSAQIIGESTPQPVPRFSKHARLVGMSSAVAPDITIGTIRFWQSRSGTAGLTNTGNFFFSGNNNAPVEIPNGSMYFSVLTGQSSDANFGVVFDLAL